MNRITKVTETIRNSVKFIREKREENNTVINGKCQKWRDLTPSPGERRRDFSSFNEYNFLICLILFSSTIIFGKLIIANNVFHRVFSWGKMWSVPFNIGDIDFFTRLSSFITLAWKVVVELNWLFIPAIVGIITSLITWRIVYWNSRIPGIDPVSPFSTRVKNKIQPLMISSNYVFAIYIGIFVFLTLFLSMFLQWT